VTPSPSPQQIIHQTINPLQYRLRCLCDINLYWLVHCLFISVASETHKLQLICLVYPRTVQTRTWCVQVSQHRPISATNNICHTPDLILRLCMLDLVVVTPEKHLQYLNPPSVTLPTSPLISCHKRCDPSDLQTFTILCHPLVAPMQLGSTFPIQSTSVYGCRT